jgi:ABC-type glycerol-3-phosphate transport system permease component
MNIPETLDDVSQIDGCNRFQTLWYIIFPNLKAVLATVILFTYIGVWGDYVSPSLYLWGYTNKYTLSIKLAASFKSEFGVMDWPKVMSACTLISIPVLIIVFVFQNALVRGIVTSGLKD